MGYESRDVDCDVEIVKVTEPGACAETGVNLAVAPSGKPCALNSISPGKSEKLETVNLKLAEPPGSIFCPPGAIEKMNLFLPASPLGSRTCTGIPIETLLSPNVYFTLISPTPGATAVTCPDESTVATS